MLTFETLPAAEGQGQLRCRAGEDILLRVIGGQVSLVMGADDLVLEPGDEAIIPAGTGHELAGVGNAARVVMGFRATR